VLSVSVETSMTEGPRRFGSQYSVGAVPCANASRSLFLGGQAGCYSRPWSLSIAAKTMPDGAGKSRFG
jgi:hypothetical protein